MLLHNSQADFAVAVAVAVADDAGADVDGIAGVDDAAEQCSQVLHGGARFQSRFAVAEAGTILRF